jgi:hypothetical protein
MVKVKEDMTGWKMWEHDVPDSRIIVLEQTEDYVKPCGRHEAQWLCECNCDLHTQFIVAGDKIRSGHTKSCGCLVRELAGQRAKKYNRYDLSGNYGIGWTTNTNDEFYFDLDDYDKIKDYCWHSQPHLDGYCSLEARNPINGKHIRMHVLLGFKWHDHIDRNPFNNRKANLRPATIQENNRNRSLSKRNTSGYIGVRWNEKLCKWTAEIRIDKKTKYLGAYLDKNEAIKARLKAESKYFGEFAPQRHLFEEYGITTRN